MLRDSLRRVLIVRAEKRRKDFEGAVNCDFDVTKKMLTSQNSKGDIRNALYALLAGAVFTQKKRMYAAKVDSAVCPFCGEGDEDTCHILWCCPKWHSVRAQMVLLNLPGSTGHRSRSYAGFMSRELRRLCTHVG